MPFMLFRRQVDVEVEDSTSIIITDDPVRNLPPVEISNPVPAPVTPATL